MPTERPTLATIHEKLKSFEAQIRAVAAGELALVALAFSDLTSTIAQDVMDYRWLIGVFVTATLVAGASTALAWIYSHSALSRLSGPGQPLTKTEADQVRDEYMMVRVLGWSSIILILVAGVVYVATVWTWVVDP